MEREPNVSLVRDRRRRVVEQRVGRVVTTIVTAPRPGRTDHESQRQQRSQEMPHQLGGCVEALVVTRNPSLTIYQYIHDGG